MFVVGHWALDENRWMNRDGSTTLNKRKPPFIGGMELVSLSCNRVFISAESVGRSWCKIAIATKLIFDTKPLSKPMLWYCNEVELRKNSSFNWFTPFHVLIRPDVIRKKKYHVHYIMSISPWYTPIHGIIRNTHVCLAIIDIPTWHVENIQLI